MQTIKILLIAFISSFITLVGSKYFQEKDGVTIIHQNETPKIIPTTNKNNNFLNPNTNFIEAAEKTVNAVVHVKNTTTENKTRSGYYFFGGNDTRERICSGSGVIISADGYIVTNHHVIENSSALEVTLNNNKTYNAEIIGTDPSTDIALIKIKTKDELTYVPFGNSDNLKIGEWVLAVGNPFNLTSTVTAGIVSAKGRDLNEFDGNIQSFIQTDAAVNRGNSGGALVNSSGDLVGINTAISSETGSYVGYSFAVPANNARKIIEDILEYGYVQKVILGISGGSLNTTIAKELNIDETEGVYINSVEKGSGADLSGIEKGDIIKSIDQQKIGKFSDLVGYLGSKQPKDIVSVTISRDNIETTIPVTLTKLETYKLNFIGLEIKESDSEELASLGLDHGVKIRQVLNKNLKGYGLEDSIIIKINDKKVGTIDDAKYILDNRNRNNPIKITFVDQEGAINSFLFR